MADHEEMLRLMAEKNKTAKLAPGHVRINTASDAPIIEIHEQTVERLTGGGKGPTAADIVIKHEDGRETRFFINVGINNQGRAICEVSTNGPRAFTKTISKSVCGYKHGSTGFLPPNDRDTK